MSIYLAELTVYDSSISGTRVLRYCTGSGFITRPSETPANTLYEPRIVQPALVRRDMFSQSTTYGRWRLSVGELVLANPDGALDGLIDYGFDGREIKIYIGDQTAAYPSGFTTVLVGRVEQVEFSWMRVAVRIRDRSKDLDKPFQTTKYLGNNSLPNGLEGLPDDIQGEPKPRGYGHFFNIAPPLVNTSRLIYQIHNGAIQDIEAVYDQGLALTRATPDYTDQTDMETNAPAAGQWRAWLGGTYFRLGATPQGQVTADGVRGAATANRTVAQIVETIVKNQGGLVDADIQASDITALDTAAPYECGIWINEERTVPEVLDEICGSVGAWWGFDRLGKFRVQQLTAPSGAAALTLTEKEIIAIERQAANDTDRGIPAYRVKLKYKYNYTVQENDIAGAVTNARRNFIKRKYRRVISTDSSVQTKYPLAPELKFETLLTSQTNAQSEADRRLTLYKTRRDTLTVRAYVAQHSPPISAWARW